MPKGKSTCKVLKEVRRKIADANDIPLQERECTHTGDCAGTCPYCESEVRYIERELSKRRALGKAVAVAGIALSAVTMAGCATSEPVSSNSTNESCKTSGRPETDVRPTTGIASVEYVGKPKGKKQKKSKSKREKKSKRIETYQIMGIVPMIDSLPKIDTIKDNPPDEGLLPDSGEEPLILGLVENRNITKWDAKEKEAVASMSNQEFDPAVFSEGKFEDWLRDRLQKFQSYMQDSRLDSVEIRFFVEEDGSVSLINILNMPEVYKPEDEAFRARVTAVISGSEWTSATVSSKPVSSIVTVRLRDLR